MARRVSDLHAATVGGDYDAAKRILDNGANPLYDDRGNEVPLYLASTTRNMDVFLLLIKRLLKNGIKINTLDQEIRKLKTGPNDRPPHNYLELILQENRKYLNDEYDVNRNTAEKELGYLIKWLEASNLTINSKLIGDKSFKDFFGDDKDIKEKFEVVVQKVKQGQLNSEWMFEDLAEKKKIPSSVMQHLQSFQGSKLPLKETPKKEGGSETSPEEKGKKKLK